MNRFREAMGRGSPVIIAHRGDSFRAPENTLHAAKLAHEARAFAWEMDVHLTRDGVPIVIHDETLERTTNVAERFRDDPRASDRFRVSDFDWAEIQSLDAGSWFVDPRGGPRSALAFGTLAAIPESERRRLMSGEIRVPSLREALILTNDLDWLVNVEIKSFPESDSRLVPEVLKVIVELQIADRILISSFDHRDVAFVVKHAPEIASGALSDTPHYRAGTYVREIIGADFHHVSHESLGSQSVEYRRTGSLSCLETDALTTLVYTVNDASENGLAKHLAKIGVVGIFTDDPRGFL